MAWMECFADSDDFMLGEAFLVAPVVECGATSRSVYLPAGPSAWFDFATGQRFEAGRMHSIPAPLSALPLFAKAGSVMPVSKAVGQRPHHDDPVGEVRRFGV